jgi:hypothetical protein
MSIPFNSNAPDQIRETMLSHHLGATQPQTTFGMLKPGRSRGDCGDAPPGPPRQRTHAKLPIRIFANHPHEPRAGHRTRAKPQIRIFANHPHEPRADHRIRAKPQIRIFANHPHEPRADRRTRAKPQIRIFANQEGSVRSRVADRTGCSERDLIEAGLN